MKTELRRARRLGLALVAVALATSAGVAHAEVIVKGTGEPPFTSSTNNTQWVEWSSNGNYRVEFNHHVDGGNATVDGPHQVGRTGSTSVNWSGIPGVSLPLVEGSAYTICGFGRWDDGTGMYFPDFSTSCGDADRRGLRASTTIDRTKPQIALALAGGAAAARSAALGLRIEFSDNLAGPFPANFLCVQYGTDGGALCDSGKGYKYLEQPACSQPLSPGRNTAFECTVDVAGATPAPDGLVSVCAMAADAAIPDDPTSDDQRGSSTSANRSDPVCDSVLLDRAAPALAIAAQPGETVTAGDLVSFSAQASDATSGLSGAYEWTWGDNTVTGSGQTATHTFTAPGTYSVTLETADAAGNTAVASRVITVKAPATPGPGSPGAPQQPTTPAPGGTPVAPTITASAPKRLKLARAKGRVPVTLAADAPGHVALALVRGGRIVAQGATRVAAGTVAYKLRLPRKARAGRHTLNVTFTPAGGRPIIRTITVRLEGKRRPVKARAASAPQTAVAGSGKRILPDGRYRGPEGRRAALGATR